jgi:predicted phosphodiesterase
MTKIQIISDIHVEHYSGLSKFRPNKEVEVIIFAGDIVGSPEQAKKFFTALRKESEAIFLYVLGNHEYFHQVFSNTVKRYKSAIKNIPNTYLLDKQNYKYNDIIFSGGTLWTDYDNRRGIPAAIFGMADFELIYKRKETLIDPNTIIEEHKKQVQFFSAQRNSTDDKHVFITHHMPSFSLIAPQFRNSTLNGSFAVNLDNLIVDQAPNIWVCGHTHSYFDTQIDKTRVICNPVGYPHEKLQIKEVIIEL